MGTYTVNCLKQFLCKYQEPLALPSQVDGTQAGQGRPLILLDSALMKLCGRCPLWAMAVVTWLGGLSEPIPAFFNTPEHLI